jgi:hypothetical protein
MADAKLAYRTAAALRLDRLYHYQSFNLEYLREVIVEGVLHFSRPSDFNDPWDCRPWFDFECLADPAIHEEHVQWYLDVSRKHRPDIPEAQLQRSADVYRNDRDALAAKIQEFSKSIGDVMNTQYRMYCLSPKADCELMWAHYGAKHQAVCLEFAVRNEFFCSAFQVEYSQTYPQFFMTGFAGATEHLAPLLTKSAAWSYEQEFRLLSDENGDPRHTIVTAGGKTPIPLMSLKAVILGCLAPESTRAAITELIAASPHRPLLKTAVRMNNKYQLIITET